MNKLVAGFAMLGTVFSSSVISADVDKEVSANIQPVASIIRLGDVYACNYNASSGSNCLKHAVNVKGLKFEYGMYVLSIDNPRGFYGVRGFYVNSSTCYDGYSNYSLEVIDTSIRNSIANIYLGVKSDGKVYEDNLDAACLSSVFTGLSAFSF